MKAATWKLFGMVFAVVLLGTVYVVQQKTFQAQAVASMLVTSSPSSPDAPWARQPYVRRTLHTPPSFRYLLYPPFPCGAGEEHLLGTFVSSAVGNAKQRAAIRATWGQTLNTLKNQQGRNDTFLFFVLGRTSNSTLQESLTREEAEHADIIQEDFEDTYLNLTLKSVMIVRWVSTFCPRIRFVFKVDDDMFVNADGLLAHLSSLATQREVLLGRLIVGATPIRSNSSKWFAPPESFEDKVYPNYLSGTGYVMSGDVADRLYAQVERVASFHLEDIYITGMLAAAAGVKPANHGGFKWYQSEAKPCQYKDHITYHKVSPGNMRSMWRDLNNRTIECSAKKQRSKS